jgi:hypothetical protein
LSGIQFVGAPTDRDELASGFARRNFKFVNYHTARTESIENRKTAGAQLASDQVICAAAIHDDILSTINLASGLKAFRFLARVADGARFICQS